MPLRPPPPCCKPPVTYAPNAGVVQAVRDECKIEELLTQRVSAALARKNRDGNGQLAAGERAPADAAVLKLSITHVLGVGGGAWSGPKAITILAEIEDSANGKRVQKLNRWSVGGFWGGFKSTCSILDRAALALAKDLTRWSFDPRFKPKEDEPKPQEGAEPAAASAAEAPPAAAAPAAASDAPPAAEPAPQASAEAGTQPAAAVK